VFGLSAVLFGAVTLIWHDPQAWEGLPFPKLPFGTVVADCLSLAQIAGGIGLLFARTGRLASIVLGVVYALFALASVAGIVAAPSAYVSYGNFFEWLAPVCGALVVFVPRAARIGLGLCAASFAAAQAVYLKYTAELVPAWIVPNQVFWVVLTTAAFALAAIALLIGREARSAARLMGVMIALFGLLVWVPMLVAHPASHFNWAEIAENYLIAGAAFLVAGAER
jgi:hypothetical protein